MGMTGGVSGVRPAIDVIHGDKKVEVHVSAGSPSVPSPAGKGSLTTSSNGLQQSQSDQVQLLRSQLAALQRQEDRLLDSVRFQDHAAGYEDGVEQDQQSILLSDISYQKRAILMQLSTLESNR